MLPADEQEVIWIDGLSIELNQLSPELEPVGICVAINGNKAIVRYKEEYDNIRWAASNRWEMDDAGITDLITKGQPVSIKINGKLQNNQLSLTGVSSRQDFIDRLNTWFRDKSKNDVKFGNYSAELAQLDTDSPALDTSDEKDGDSYRNRIIINAKFVGNINNFSITIGTYKGTKATGKHIADYELYDFLGMLFFNNGFDYSDNDLIPLNKALLQDNLNEYSAPDTPLDDITSLVNKEDFESNENCQILRDTFASYDDYVDSLLVKFPCGKGYISKYKSGKENTYKLVDCKYTNLNGYQEYLYPAARKAASIDVNGPKLTAGNWWLPSPAELAQMMRDITYDTSFWDSKPDIVNRVIEKIRLVDDNWTYMSASTFRWMPILFKSNYVSIYFGYDGTLGNSNPDESYTVTPITIYEF